jgi:aquaporin Z
VDSSRQRADPPAAGWEISEKAVVVRALGAECVGTFALTFVAAGGEVVAHISGGAVDHTARALAPGLTVLGMIYALGQVSGTHINPAVTFAFALRGVFPWRRAPGYWLAQAAGALMAAMFLRQLFGNVAQLGANQPRGGVSRSLVMETVLTFLLVTVILGTASRARLLGPGAAIAVGGTVAFAGLFAAPISGASMNPARSLAPAIVAGTLADQWLYLIGPTAGAALAVGLAWLLHGPPDRAEVEAAEGQDTSGEVR